MKCPGQDTQYWNPEAIFEVNCPNCGKNVEFFKDDTARKCEHCGHRFANPRMDFGCAAYCKYAEHCIGTLPPELLAQKEDLLKDRVAIEMKKYFKRDFKRIGRATRIARHAEQIGKAEGGNLSVILSASYLHGMDNGTAPSDPAPEPAIARSILETLKAREGLIGEVCDILKRRRMATGDDSLETRVVHDAVLLERLMESQKETVDANVLKADILGRFLTAAGRVQAEKALLSSHRG